MTLERQAELLEKYGTVPILELCETLDIATERAEKAEALTRELEEARSFQINFEHATKLDREMFTKELEAERAGAAARLELLLKFTCPCGAREHSPEHQDGCLIGAALASSTAGAKMLERVNDYRKFLGQIASNLGVEIVGEQTQWMCAIEDALAELAERLRKAEAERGSMADAWQKAEGALNDMEIAKNERITTLEAALTVVTEERDTARRLAREFGERTHAQIVELEAALEEARKALADAEKQMRIIAVMIPTSSSGQACERSANQAHAAYERIGRTLEKPAWVSNPSTDAVEK